MSAFPSTGFNFFGSQPQQQQQQTTPATKPFSFDFSGTQLQQQPQQQPQTGSLFGQSGSIFGSPSSSLTQPQQQQQQQAAPVPQTLSLFPAVGQQPQPQQQVSSLFPQPQVQQQPAPAQPNATLDVDISSPKIFGDSRDVVLGQLNRVQALYGTGKAIYSANGANVQTFDLSQYPGTSRLKTVAYSELRRDEDEDRIGVLVKYENEVNLKAAILIYENNLKSVFNNYPVKIDTTKILPGQRALMTFSVTDPMSQRKLPASQLTSHLSNQSVKNQLPAVFQNNFIQMLTLNSMSKQEIEQYLSTPPSGLDATVWAQAKAKNPDPSRFIPVPLLGFESLNERFKLEEQEVFQQKNRIKLICDSILELEKSVEATKAKLEECRKRNAPLSVKVLRLMIAQELEQKRGTPVQPEEDALRARLESINIELNAPTKFRGCLNELMSSVRQMQTHKLHTSSAPAMEMSAAVVAELKTHLKRESEAISHLLSILREDQESISRLSSPPVSGAV
jgi:nuclear pore complex protein Nup54